MTGTAEFADIEGLSFEQAMAELETIVQRLERGQITLDEAIGTYERGSKLKSHCEAKLALAKARVDQITIGPDGAIGTTALPGAA